MFEQLLEQLESILQGDQVKYDFFMNRTLHHIHLTQKAAEKIVKAYPEYVELATQVLFHDASKFQDPEIGPYIEMTWNRKEGIKADELTQEKIIQATLHHIKNNRHHPEFHLEDKTKANLSSTNRDKSIECVDASNMGEIDVAEMVADWVAMSEELKTNTARQWFDSVKDVRWSFSKDQEVLIDKLLGVFE